MGIRIENADDINFGTLDTQTVLTHGRVSVGAVVLGTEPLSEQITIKAGGSAENGPGSIDLLFPSNRLEDDGFSAFLALALNGRNVLQVDMMTSETQVVQTNGYAQQETANWTRTIEPDPTE